MSKCSCSGRKLHPRGGERRSKQHQQQFRWQICRAAHASTYTNILIQNDCIVTMVSVSESFLKIQITLFKVSSTVLCSKIHKCPYLLQSSCGPSGALVLALFDAEGLQGKLSGHYECFFLLIYILLQCLYFSPILHAALTNQKQYFSRQQQ